ncbi:hypothetical protein ACVXHA_21380 [Escherichia coli]
MFKGDDTSPASGRILVNPVEMKPNPAASAEVWKHLKRYLRKPDHRRARPARRLTALAQELVDDGILDGAVRKAHAALHAVLDKFQMRKCRENQKQTQCSARRRWKAVVDLTQQ